MSNEQRYAVVRDGVVENVVVWDGESDWQPPEGTTLVLSDEAGPGDTHDGKTFTPPEPPTPDPVVEYEAKVAEELRAMAAERLAQRGVMAPVIEASVETKAG